MNREDFIIHVYCWVCDEYGEISREQRIRKAGFAPAFTDEEVITIEICGECFGLNKDEAIYEHFDTYYRHFFPKLPERSLFVRQAANLWQVKMRIQQKLVSRCGQDQEAVQVIDTLPLPMCVFTRSRRDRCFKPDADYGYCAAKQLYYYGFKLGLRISPLGMITHYALLPARPHDIQLLDDLLAGFTGVALGDKGFINTLRQQELANKRCIELLTPTRRNMARHLPPPLQRLTRRWRKLIETVGSQLAGRFAIEQIRVRDLWHLQHRIIRKVLAHTLAVVFNLQLGRSPLDFDGLLTD
jgi:Transposase DDE domain